MVWLHPSWRKEHPKHRLPHPLSAQRFHLSLSAKNNKRINTVFIQLSDRVFPSLEWLPIPKSVLSNFAIIQILPCLNNPKDLPIYLAIRQSFPFSWMTISILFYPITLEGRRGTTDEFATIPFHLDLFSAALVELAKSIPVHSLILSSHLFFCLPLFLFPFTVPWRIVFAKPEDLETWPNHLSFRFLTRVRSSSYSPMAAWIFLQTSSLVTWSLYEMFNSLR